MQEPNISDHAPAQTGCALRLFRLLVSDAIVYGEIAFPGVLDGVVALT